jgi:hypothetical protein
MTPQDGMGHTTQTTAHKPCLTSHASQSKLGCGLQEARAAVSTGLQACPQAPDGVSSLGPLDTQLCPAQPPAHLIKWGPPDPLCGDAVPPDAHTVQSPGQTSTTRSARCMQYAHCTPQDRRQASKTHCTCPQKMHARCLRHQHSSTTPQPATTRCPHAAPVYQQQPTVATDQGSTMGPSTSRAPPPRIPGCWSQGP